MVTQTQSFPASELVTDTVVRPVGGLGDLDLGPILVVGSSSLEYPQYQEFFPPEEMERPLSLRSVVYTLAGLSPNLTGLLGCEIDQVRFVPEEALGADQVPTDTILIPYTQSQDGQLMRKRDADGRPSCIITDEGGNPWETFSAGISSWTRVQWNLFPETLFVPRRPRDEEPEFRIRLVHVFQRANDGQSIESLSFSGRVVALFGVTESIQDHEDLCLALDVPIGEVSERYDELSEAIRQSGTRLAMSMGKNSRTEKVLDSIERQKLPS